MALIRKPEGVYGSYSRFERGEMTLGPTRTPRPIDTLIFELVHSLDTGAEVPYQTLDGTSYELVLRGPTSVEYSFTNPMPPRNDLIELAAEITRVEQILREETYSPLRRMFHRIIRSLRTTLRSHDASNIAKKSK